MMDRNGAAGTTTTTRRKPIPRPWLENRRLSSEAKHTSKKLQTSQQQQHHQQQHQRHQLQQQQQQQQHQYTNDDVLWHSNEDEYDDDEHFHSSIILLDKPDIRKSLFNMECCFPNKSRLNVKSDSNLNTNHDRSTPPMTPEAGGIAVETYFHDGSTTVVYPPPPPPPPPHGHVQRPQNVVRDSSGRWFTPTPTVIYVIHHGGGCDGPSQDIHQWHQSFMSSQQQQQLMAPIPLNRDRIQSYDTGMTSLSCDDSLAFTDDLRPQQKPPSTTAPGSRQGLRSGRVQLQRNATTGTTNPSNNSIPRPPPMTRKALSTSSGLPPMAPAPGVQSSSNTPATTVTGIPLLVQHQRPAHIRTRAATTGSVSSVGSANSRHRRSPILMDVLDSTALNSIFQQNGQEEHFEDDDFDDDTIASSEGHSPIFPFLPAVSTSSLQSGGVCGEIANTTSKLSFQQQQQECIEEVYLPKCNTLESSLASIGTASTTIASVPLLSGWLAYSLGDSLLHKRHLTRQHLAYMTMDDLTGEIYFRQPPGVKHGSQHQSELSSSSGQESGEEVPCCKSSSSPPHESFSTVVFTLPRMNERNKISVQTLESQGGAGRSVVIRNTHENKTLLTLLPINMSSNQFCSETGRILSRSLLANATMGSNNNINKNSLNGSIGHAGSVAQHDAALYLWFGLDGWVRRQEQRQQQLRRQNQ